MSEAALEQLSQDIERATSSLRYWWQRNDSNRFWDDEAVGWERQTAEDILVQAHNEVGREHKIQLVAGEKAVQLFSFGTNAYDFLTIDRHLGDAYDLQPGESMDLVHVHEQIGNYIYHGNLHALYMGHVLHTHSIAIAETLSLGGGLAITAQDTEETYSFRR